MDDDIDIEEHDVLDNPKIKSIFPDLSRVKIEVPDEEDDVQLLNDPDDEQQLRYQNFNLTAENPEFTSHDNSGDPDADFVDNGDSVNNANIVEYSEVGEFCVDNSYVGDQVTCELANDHTYAANVNCENSDDNVLINGEFDDNVELNGYIPNKILLGSKPYCKSIETDEYSNEIILGTKPNEFSDLILDYDVLYQEALCSKTAVVLEDWGVKLDTNCCFCKECNILFPTINALDAHKMIRHSFLVALDVQYNTARKSTSAKNSGKLCNHCKLYFPDDTSLIKHLYELLPLSNFEDSHAVKKEPGEAVLDTNTSKLKYKCTSCQLILQTNYAARKHRLLAHPDARQSKIFVPIKTQHVNEHDDANNVAENPRNFKLAHALVSDTIFQCPRCHVHFLSSSTAVHHLRSCKHTINCAYSCKVCKLHITMKDKVKHSLQHKLVREIKCLTVTFRFREKILWRCPKCSVCCSESGLLPHYTACVNKASLSKSLFRECAICNFHVEACRFLLHQKRHRQRSKDDFIVIECFERPETERCVDKIEKKPSVNEVNETSDKKIRYLYCKYCSCCLYHTHWKVHGDNCVSQKSSRRQCEQCGLVFMRKSATVHALLHTKRKVTLDDFVFVGLFSGKRIKPPITDIHKCQSCKIVFVNKNTLAYHICNKEKFKTCYECNKKYNLQAYSVHMQYHSSTERTLMPQLLKKYDSMNETWNIVYMCSSCSIVSMSYDFAVEHSQRHINNVANDTFVYCLRCSLNIEKSYYSSHSSLHESNPTDTNLFNIFTYDYQKLFKDEWLDLFQTLPKQDVDIILSVSIYRYARNVKMNRMTKSVKHKSFKYYCDRCKVYVDDVLLHINGGCVAALKHKCDYCNIRLKSLEKKLAHEHSHGARTNHIAYITFNDEKDEAFNKNLQLYAAKGKRLDQKSKVNKVIHKRYRCSNCLVVEMIVNKTSHQCSLNDRTFCEKCDEYYASDTYEKHLKAHEKMPFLSKKTLNVIDFTKKDKFLLYRCKRCTVCLHSYAWIARHVCLPKSKKIHCELCGLNFSIKTFLKHTTLHSNCPNLNRETIRVEEFDTKKTLDVIRRPDDNGYQFIKCRYCHVSCTKKGISSHKCAVAKRYCAKCKLSFTLSFFKQHKCALVGRSVGSNLHIKLYRCADCKKCYRKKDWAQSHTCRLEARNCPSCDLLFSRKNFGFHLAMHKRHHNLLPYLTVENVNNSGRVLDAAKIRSPSKISAVTHNKAHSKKEYIFYKCQKCDTAFSSKSSLPRHDCSESHFKIYCKKCGIHIAKCELLIHKKLHRKQPGLSKKSIKIVVVNDFKTTVDKSERSATTKVAEQYYMYKCRDCKVCLGYKDSFKTHTCNNDTIFCPVCFVSLSRYAGAQRHNQRHIKYPDVDRTNIKICYFDKKGVSVEEEPVDMKSEYLNAVKRCDSCIAYTIGCEHKCDLANTTICPKCHENFSADSLQVHLQAHDLFPELFTAPDSQVSKVMESKGKMSKVTVYSCTCDLHFTSLTSIQKHMDVCGTTEVCTEKCSKCSLLFPTDILVTHLINHHSANTSKVLVKRVHRARFYGCPKCEARYRRKEDLDEHLENYCNNEDSLKCESCDMFYEKTYVSSGEHKCVNTNTDLYINDLVQDLVNNLTVFKCHVCHVHFCSLTAYQFHPCADNGEDVRTCDICQLSFTSGSFNEHNKVHNSGEYRITITQPGTKEVNVISGKNTTVDIDQESVASHSNSVAEVSNLRRRKRRRETDDDCEVISGKNTVDVDQESIASCSNSVAEVSNSRRGKWRRDTEDNCQANETPTNQTVVEDAADDEDTMIWKYPKLDNTVYKCEKCSLCYLQKETVLTHIKRNPSHRVATVFTCKICKLDFPNKCYFKHKIVHHELMKLRELDDFVIEIVGEDDHVEYDESAKGSRLYQCYHCKVAFTTLTNCLSHLQDHKAVNAKFSIACKVCGCQFLISDLKEHMEINHGDVYVDEVMVEEYMLVKGDLVRMNVFNVVDRIQSEMVSTTTGVDGDPLSMEEGSQD